ncbi:MAG: DUF423 domain-containing protein [Verrucomicrobium sp.]|nr:DUF423 domain-containing protein [Verrucomicrobium sp.]
MIPSPSRALLAAAFLGFTGVALGAFGAHALAPLLERRGLAEVWRTAVFYQFVHALALLFLSREGGTPRWIAGAWIAGAVLFSGSLYLICLGAPRWTGAVTPLGGLGFLAGWAGLAWWALRRK